MATRQDPPLTAGEYAQIAWYSARILKRGIADDGTERVYLDDLKRKIDRIIDRAQKRADQAAKKQ